MRTIMFEIHTGMYRYLSLYSLIPFMDESKKHSYHFLALRLGSAPQAPDGLCDSRSADQVELQQAKACDGAGSE